MSDRAAPERDRPPAVVINITAPAITGSADDVRIVREAMQRAGARGV